MVIERYGSRDYAEHEWDMTACDVCGADLYSFELPFGVCGNCQEDLEKDDYEDL